MFARGLSNSLNCFTDGYLEDRIIIECPDNTDIACQPHNNKKPAMVRLFMARSQLIYSEWFVKWFNSPYYLARGGMKVTWHRDPIACWEMAKSYMEDGYDRFGRNQITSYVCTRFPLADRFMVLVRLLKLARVLDLFGLMDGAFVVLRQMEHLIAPPNVITLARYIFGGEDYCENIPYLRKWCLKWVDKHYDWLVKSEQWTKVIKNSVLDLEEQWIRITTMKRIKSQEELRRAIQRNLCDATAIIDAMNAVDELPEAPVKDDTNDNKNVNKHPDIPKKEYTFTRLARNGTETPSKEQPANEKIVGLSEMRSSLSLDDNELSKCNSTDEGESRPPIPKKSSLRNILEVEGCEMSKDGVKTKGGGHLVPIPRKSSFEEVFDFHVKYDTAAKQNKEAQQDRFELTKKLSNSPIASSLNTSFSEPLLTSCRYGEICTNGKGGKCDYQRESNRLSQPAKDNDKLIQQQEDTVRSSQRGIFLTVGALCEPDSWPLADIPLPDPLLPLARRAPSLDTETAHREQHKSTTHNTQTVTVFGIHRPGMGGSIIPIEENGNSSESHARTANEAKAREFLGIDQPVTVGMAKSVSRSSLDSEPKKLKRKTPWLAKHG